MLLSQIGQELTQDKELRQQPRITRAIYWTVIGLALLFFWLIILSKSSYFSWAQVFGLVSPFLFLGLGVREFLKYKRSLALAERGDKELLPTGQEPWGKVLNLTPAEQAHELSTSTGLAVPVIREEVPSVTESTTQHLDVKHPEGE